MPTPVVINHPKASTLAATIVPPALPADFKNRFMSIQSSRGAACSSGNASAVS
jgi:hypothetical protein